MVDKPLSRLLTKGIGAVYKFPLSSLVILPIQPYCDQLGCWYFRNESLKDGTACNKTIPFICCTALEKADWFGLKPIFCIKAAGFYFCSANSGNFFFTH